MGRGHTHAVADPPCHLIQGHAAVNRAGEALVRKAINRRQNSICRVRHEAVDHRIVANGKGREIRGAMLETRPDHCKRHDGRERPDEQHRCRAPGGDVADISHEVTDNDQAQCHDAESCAQQQGTIAAPQHREHFAGIDEVLDEQPVRPAVVLEDELRSDDLEEQGCNQPDGQPRVAQPRPRRQEPRDREQRHEYERRRRDQAKGHQVIAQALQQYEEPGIDRADSRPLPRQEPRAGRAERDNPQQDEADDRRKGTEAPQSAV